jgi:hypothetical protein
MPPASLSEISPGKRGWAYVSHVERRVRSFLGNKVSGAIQRQAICGDDIRSCSFRPGKPEKSVLKQRWRR